MALYILYSCPLSAGFQHALLLSGRCIPDVSLERDVLHIHLLLYHLLLSSFLKNNFVYLFTFDCTGSSLLHGLCSRGGAQPFHCRGFSCGARAPGCASSGVVSQRPRCSVTCGILPDQGSNLCLLHWQANSLPLSHQGNPSLQSLTKEFSFSLLLNQPGSPSNGNTRQKNPCWVLIWEGQ